MYDYLEREHRLGIALKTLLNQYIKDNPKSVFCKRPKSYIFETYDMFGYPYEAFWIEKGNIENFVEYIGDKYIKINSYPYDRERNKGIMAMAEQFFNTKDEELPNLWMYMYLYSINGYLADSIFGNHPNLHYTIHYLWVGDDKNYDKVKKEINFILRYSKITTDDIIKAFNKIIPWIENDIKRTIKSFELVGCVYEHGHPYVQIMFCNNRAIYRIEKGADGKYYKRPYTGRRK